jgi:hypothetical protein
MNTASVPTLIAITGIALLCGEVSLAIADLDALLDESAPHPYRPRVDIREDHGYWYRACWGAPPDREPATGFLRTRTH